MPSWTSPTWRSPWPPYPLPYDTCHPAPLSPASTHPAHHGIKDKCTQLGARFILFQSAYHSPIIIFRGLLFLEPRDEMVSDVSVMCSTAHGAGHHTQQRADHPSIGCTGYRTSLPAPPLSLLVRCVPVWTMAVQTSRPEDTDGARSIPYGLCVHAHDSAPSALRKYTHHLCLRRRHSV